MIIINKKLRLSILLFGSLILTSCNKSSEKENQAAPPVAVTIHQVKQGDAVYHDYYTANVTAMKEVELRSQVNGYITAILFEEGSRVRKGQKLYEIDRTKYAAAYAQATASWQVAKSNLEKAKNDAARFEELGKRDAVAKQRVEYAQTDFLNAQQQVEAAMAQVENTRADLEYATIKAPFDGTIGISQLRLGGYVVAGQTFLNTISSDDPISVDFVISEREIPRFTELHKASQNSKDSIFTISFGNRIYPYPGKVEIFDRAVDPQTGTLKIRLRFPNPERLLKAGMSTQVRVLNKSQNDAVLVPNKAITEQMGEFFVYVVAKDTARQRNVIPGETIGKNIIIKEGLKPGENIVVEGIQKLREGSPVQNSAAVAGSANQDKNSALNLK